MNSYCNGKHTHERSKSYCFKSYLPTLPNNLQEWKLKDVTPQKLSTSLPLKPTGVSIFGKGPLLMWWWVSERSRAEEIPRCPACHHKCPWKRRAGGDLTQERKRWRDHTGRDQSDAVTSRQGMPAASYRRLRKHSHGPADTLSSAQRYGFQTSGI